MRRCRAAHLRGRRLGASGRYGDAVRLLGDHGVLTTELAVSMRKAVGFRNVLVHDYIEVDDSIVAERLKSLGDLEEFVRQVAAYVTGRQPGPESPRQPPG
ncbi:MAG: type VII toxin-antitoxin system HepT family RNase toxin [Streptosporangiaceae bacterium]